MKKKVIKAVPARDGQYLIKLECGHKRYSKSKNSKELVCKICTAAEKVL